MDLGHSAHRGPGVAVGGFLVDGNGGRKPLDVVHIRLFHLAQEHAGIAGKTFHIAALAVRVNGVEREAGFAAARKAGHHHQLVPRNGKAHIFQVVLPRAPDHNFVVAHLYVSLSLWYVGVA